LDIGYDDLTGLQSKAGFPILYLEWVRLQDLLEDLLS
jgi:hypothetical protein